MDWAIKFLPLRHREQIRDFFGKRGKSWHISCGIEKQEERFSVQCFVHLFEQCKQDWFAVASIIESLLKTVKTEQPFITEAFLRSDNGLLSQCAIVVCSSSYWFKDRDSDQAIWFFWTPSRKRHMRQKDSTDERAHQTIFQPKGTTL